MSDFSHIPSGYHSATPSLTVKDAAGALDFYQRAFGAVEHYRLPDAKDGRIMHAEFAIGNSIFMISSEYPEWGALAPAVGQGGLFMIYVPNCEAAYAQALAAGASSTREPADQFWGDRTAGVNDPHGYRWTLAQKVKDVSPEDIAKGAAEWGN